MDYQIKIRMNRKTKAILSEQDRGDPSALDGRRVRNRKGGNSGKPISETLTADRTNAVGILSVSNA